MTASSESEFIVPSVCEAPIISAKGMTITTMAGIRSPASSRNVSKDWPVELNKFTRISTCVVKAITVVVTKVPIDRVKTLRNM